MRHRDLAVVLVLAALLAAAPGVLRADGAAPAGGAALAESIGPVTGLALPRFVSLGTDRGNLRRGPSLTHKVDWVYVRPGIPLRVTAEFGNWRRVRDGDGVGGWIHAALLSGRRSAIVRVPMAALHRRPDADAPLTARLEKGVVGRLTACRPAWCRFDAGHYAGWMPKSALWGVTDGEVWN